jgi:TRAP-type C4-dicarboxylate transport system permease small subunit
MMAAFQKLLRICFDIAGVAVLALMTLTVVDIVGRHLGILNLRGTIEMSNSVTVLIGFLAFPFSFLVGGHLVLDTFTSKLPSRINRGIDMLWFVLAAAAFSVAGYLTWLAAIDAYETNELSMDLQLPMIVLWIPAAVGLTLTPPACVIAATRLFRDQTTTEQHSQFGIE